ncbi:MAG: class I SAM-dependent methyltransferase [Pyrodictiaceae archaeon]
MGIPSIPEEDGMCLYSLLTSFSMLRGRPRKVLDLGAGIGYSTLWMAKALEDSCGKKCEETELVAVEQDPGYASIALRHLGKLKMVGVKLEVVNMKAQDYLKSPPPSSVDFAFIDIWEHEYIDVLKAMEEKLVDNGVIVFHNAFMPSPPREFFMRANTRPWRSIVVPTRLGLLVVTKTQRA